VNRWLVAFASVFSLGGLCGPGSGPPPPDRCTSPASNAIIGVEIGPEMNEAHGFEAWAADDTGYITSGFQGGYMLGVSLRLSGDAPACLKQNTTVTLAGTKLAQEASPLNTYDAPDGTRTTRTMWLVFDDSGPPIGTQVLVTTEAGGTTVSSNVTIAQDRHRLESLTVLTPIPKVGSPIELELTSRHAPEFTSFTPTFSTSSLDVVSLLSGLPPFIYDDVKTFQLQAVGAGETDIVVTLRDQELRAHVVVAP
jgi:hypothetical protein